MLRNVVIRFLLASPFLFHAPLFGSTKTEADQIFANYNQTRNGSDSLKQRFGNFSDQAAEARHKKYVQFLSVAKSLDKAQLSKSDQLSLELLIYLLNDHIEGFQWRFHQSPIDHVTAPHTQLPRDLTNKHAVIEIADAKNYILKIKDLARILGDIQAAIDTRAKMGIVAPTFVLDRVLADAQNIIAGEPFVAGQPDNALLADFKSKVEALKLAPEERDALIQEAKKAMTESMGPAYQKLFAQLQALRAQSNNVAGVHKLPRGAEFYRYMLKQHTSTAMTPEEIHQLGVDEVAFIHANIVRDMKLMGYKGDISEMLKIIRDTPDFKYVPTDESKQKYRDTLKAILEKIESHLPLIFEKNIFPEAKYKVVEVTSGAAFYYAFPALDGSTPGIYYISLQDLSLPMMESLAYHEVIPGHHMNVAVQQEQVGVPDFRRNLALTAHGEGWGMYSEMLPNDSILGQKTVEEIGAYKEPVQRIGQSLAALKKAIRLVVDTGMHHFGWSKERAANYMADNSTTFLKSTMSDMDRYSIWPGQSTAYMIGYKQILKLRKKAVDELGSQFDIREFHTAMIGYGTLPLDILEALVLDPWIAAKKKKVEAGGASICAGAAAPRS